MNLANELTFDSTDDERATLPVPIETADELIEWYEENPPPFHWLEIGWSLRRSFGDDGYDLFCRSARSWDSPAYETASDVIDKAWVSFDRAGPTQFDRLLIDEMGWARNRGWKPPESDMDAKFAELHAQGDELAAAESNIINFRNWIAAEAEERNQMRPNLSVVPALVTIPQPDLIRTSGEFVQGFIPPEYLVDGVLQRRFCYSITAQTGVGKTTVAMLLSAHVSEGRPLGSLEVAKGSVLYFAGENPTDIQMRWLGLTQEMGLDPATTDVHFITGAMPLSQVAERITAEVARKGLRLALCVVDTSAAYNEGDDENSNTQAATHARRMRSLTELPGEPCVLILCHPTKRAGDDELIPRGGGAFLAEVDGNIALQKRDSLVVANAQGKFRGPEFVPLSFELASVSNHPVLRDARGRYITTVVARTVGAADKSRLERSGRMEEDMVLRVLDRTPGASPTDIARTLGWTIKGGAIHHVKAKRLLDRLSKEKLVDERRGGWRLTQSGQKELNEAERNAQGVAPTIPLPNIARPL